MIDITQLLQSIDDATTAVQINTQYLVIIGAVLSFALGFIAGNQR